MADLDELTPATEEEAVAEYIAVFERDMEDDDLELDTNEDGLPKHSLGDDDGCWVRAWAWVPTDATSMIRCSKCKAHFFRPANDEADDDDEDEFVPAKEYEDDSGAFVCPGCEEEE